MTATPKAYLPRFYSEVVREAGSPDDCVVCASLELYDAATMGEGVTRNNGTLMDTIALRELRDNAGLTPDGPLRLNDAAKYLAFVSTRAGMDPPFVLDYYPGHPGGTLRLTWDQFRGRIMDGHVGVLLGNPIGVKSPTSPLRTVQNNDDYGHAIALMDGTANGARVYDALNRKGERFAGVRVSWDDLRQFTEVRKGGERLYGTSIAIACAVARIGGETAAERATRASAAKVDRLTDRLRDQRAQTALALEERDQARAELALANTAVAELREDNANLRARVAELENRAPEDCSLIQASLDAARRKLLAIRTALDTTV